MFRQKERYIWYNRNVGQLTVKKIGGIAMNKIQQWLEKKFGERFAGILIQTYDTIGRILAGLLLLSIIYWMAEMFLKSIFSTISLWIVPTLIILMFYMFYKVVGGKSTFEEQLMNKLKVGKQINGVVVRNGLDFEFSGIVTKVRNKTIELGEPMINKTATINIRDIIEYQVDGVSYTRDEWKATQHEMTNKFN